MLRKISHIIILTLLMTTTSGLIITRHYCMGEMIGFELFSEAEPCCDDQGCCQDETDYMKIKDAFFASGILDHLPVFQNFTDVMIQPTDQIEPTSYLTETKIKYNYPYCYLRNKHLLSKYQSFLL